MFAPKYRKRQLIALTFVMFIFVLAFNGILPLEVHATTVQTASNINAGNSVSQGFNSSVTAGNTLIVLVSYSSNAGNPVLGTPSDSQSNSFTLQTNFNSATSSGSAVAAWTATFSASGSDTVSEVATSGTGGASAMAVIEITDSAGAIGFYGASTDQTHYFGYCGKALGSGGGTGCTISSNQIIVLANVNTGSGTMFTMSWSGHQINNNGAGNFQTIIGSGSGTFSYNANNPVYAIIGAYFIGSGGGCSIYACSTSTYSTSFTNQFCLTNPSVCTNETTSTTWHYDATSSVITYTTCSTVGNGSQYCVTQTKSVSATETFTDTSVSLIFSTVTVTKTNTAIVAPTSTSLLYWFFGFLLLIIPPATLVGVVKGRNSGADIEFPIMTGLLIGAFLSLLVQLLVAGIGFAVIAIYIIYLWRRGS